MQSSSLSRRSSTASSSLRPPAAKNLMPLSAYGLCDAEITAPGDASGAERHATSGVGATPSRATSTPSEDNPAARDASSIGPDRRVSRPTRNGVPGSASTRAAARPRASTSSGVSSTFATPRTPSVPNFSVREPLALGVLRGLAGLLQAVLLALLLTGVAREKAGPLERDPDFGVEVDKGAGDTETESARLARHAAAEDGGVDVVHLVGAGGGQRLAQHHAVGLGGEVVLDGTAVDDDLAGAGPDANTGHGLLAATGRLDEGLGHELSPSVLGAGAGEVENLGRLGDVGVLGPGVDLELAQHLAAERALGQHAAHGFAHRLLGLGGQNVGVALLLQTARVAGMPVHHLLGGLVGRDHDFGHIHDDDVVARVEVAGERRLVLAPQDACHLGGHAP